jgi:hypothetical protein
MATCAISESVAHAFQSFHFFAHGVVVCDDVGLL